MYFIYFIIIKLTLKNVIYCLFYTSIYKLNFTWSMSFIVKFNTVDFQIKYKSTSCVWRLIVFKDDIQFKNNLKTQYINLYISLPDQFGFLNSIIYKGFHILIQSLIHIHTIQTKNINIQIHIESKHAKKYIFSSNIPFDKKECIHYSTQIK